MSEIPDSTELLNGCIFRIITHFHAEYQGMKAEYDISTLDLLAGSLSKRANVMVLEWASLHKEELMNNWKKAIILAALDKIEPLN